MGLIHRVSSVRSRGGDWETEGVVTVVKLGVDWDTLHKPRLFLHVLDDLAPDDVDLVSTQPPTARLPRLRMVPRD